MAAKQESSEAFKNGISVRGEVLGEEYVSKALALQQDEFWQPAQQLITEYAWGTVWTRPGLERKQRSLLSMSNSILTFFVLTSDEIWAFLLLSRAGRS